MTPMGKHQDIGGTYEPDKKGGMIHPGAE